MNLYRVVLVEDEDLIRKGLRFLIPWIEYGCQVVGEACNGAEGVREIIRLQADLVITDVRMPLLDGLGMLEKLQREHPSLRFSTLILSSYDEFEYAQTAIKLGVDEYLLKPIREEEMRAAIARILAKKQAQQRLEFPYEWGLLREQLFAQLPLQLQEERSEGSSIPDVQEIVAYVHEHACEKLRADQVSQRFYRSPSRFQTEFKAQTGYPFNEYLNRYRIALALQCMKETEAPLQEIARRVGFEDSKYFTRVFRKFLGKSPRQVREELRGELG